MHPDTYQSVPTFPLPCPLPTSSLLYFHVTYVLSSHKRTKTHSMLFPELSLCHFMERPSLPSHVDRISPLFYSQIIFFYLYAPHCFSDIPLSMDMLAVSMSWYHKCCCSEHGWVCISLIPRDIHPEAELQDCIIILSSVFKGNSHFWFAFGCSVLLV